ncbi:unnamed protein product, partial [Rotaria sp. Silwood1]
NSFIEIILTAKRMIFNPVKMILYYLWVVITRQEDDWIQKRKQLAEQDLNNKNDEMPNEFIQGIAVTVRIYIFFSLQSLINK